MSLIAAPVQELLIILVEGLKAPGWKRVRQQKKARAMFFLPGGGLWKFFKFCKFLVIPYCMSRIFLISPEVLQNLSDPPTS